MFTMNPEEYVQHIDYLNKAVYMKNDLSFLQEVAKAIVDDSQETSVDGFEAFAESLKDIAVSLMMQSHR